MKNLLDFRLELLKHIMNKFEYKSSLLYQIYRKINISNEYFILLNCEKIILLNF